MYPLNGEVHNLEQNRPLTLDVKNEGVPEDADEVIVYAKLRTGNNGSTGEDGELVVSVTIPNGRIERKLFCYTYPQSAWSYNSENIALPVGAGPGLARQIAAELKAKGNGVFGSVQIVGYRKQHK